MHQVFTNHQKLVVELQGLLNNMCIALFRGDILAELASDPELVLELRKTTDNDNLTKRFQEHLRYALPALYAEVLVISVHIRAYCEGTFGQFHPFKYSLLVRSLNFVQKLEY